MYLTVGTISFPGLGIDGINPPQTLPFTIFGKEIYLYGVVIALGFLLAIFYARFRCRDLGFDFDHLIDAVLFAVPMAIICARLYYVIFEWKNTYSKNPISALYIWEGGLAIYGGVIGAILGLILFSKIRKQKLTPYLDIMGLGLPIGQLIGRWGNFFNREAYGAEIKNNFFLRMGLTTRELVSGIPVETTRYWHPTFLYESVWNLVGFILLHILSKKRKYDGQIFLMYVAWYGLGRVWIEGLRTDSLWIGSPGSGIRVSQLLAGVSFLAAVGVMLWIRFKKHPDGSTMLVNQPQPEASSPEEAAPAAVQENAAEARETVAEAQETVAEAKETVAEAKETVAEAKETVAEAKEVVDEVQKADSEVQEVLSEGAESSSKTENNP